VPDDVPVKEAVELGVPEGDGDALDEAVADGVAVDDDVAVPDDELETVALLLGVAELELEADALPDKVGVVDELEDVDPVDVELGVAVLDAVADADGDDELVWVPLRGPVALGLAARMTPRTCPTTSPDEEAVELGVPEGDGDALDEAVADGVAVDDDDGSARRRAGDRWRCCWAWRSSSSKPTRRCRMRSES
jgi:hypothetical protein